MASTESADPASKRTGYSAKETRPVLRGTARTRRLCAVFGEQAGTKLSRGRAMHPYAGRGRHECIHALRQQTQDQAAQNIAGTGGGEAGGGVGIDDGPTIGGRHHGVGALQHHDRSAAARRGASAAQFVSGGVE